MWVKKQQLEPCVEKPTGLGLIKEYNKAVCCHPAYLIYMQITCKLSGWISYKLESRLLGEISTTSDMWLIHSVDRKCRGTKEPLDEGKGGEW